MNINQLVTGMVIAAIAGAIVYIAVFTMPGKPDPCRDSRIERTQQAVAVHEECRELEGCIFEQYDISYYKRNLDKLEACKRAEANENGS